MTATTRSIWIRQRTLLAITPPPWHVEQQVTPGGIVVTSCAIVITPEEVERFVDDPDPMDLSDACCQVCSDHLATAD